MNLRTVLFTGILLAAAPMHASVVYVEVDGFPQYTAFNRNISYDEDSKVWTLTVENNDFGGFRPIVNLSAFDAPLPDDCETFSFEYKVSSTTTVDYIMQKTYRGTSTKEYLNVATAPQSDEWQKIRIYVGDVRTQKLVAFGNKAGQYQQLRFNQVPNGGTVQLRNLRYEPDQLPYKEVQVVSGQPTIVEAENFNEGAQTGAGYTSNQLSVPADMIKYRNPLGDRFPIYAWGSIDYVGGIGVQGAVDLLKKQWAELKECGFTMTSGSASVGVDLAYLYDDREINGVYVALHDYAPGLMIIANSGLYGYGQISENVPRYRGSDRLAGYMIMDEPFRQHMPEMRDKVLNIRKFDPDRLLYGNLHNASSSITAIGYNNYDEYVHDFVRSVGTGLLSYDFYPVRAWDEAGTDAKGLYHEKDEIYIEEYYFWNLEMMSKLSKYYQIPFWAFAHSVASECGKDGVHYPTPQEDHMRVQIFGNLIYGAQGLQYFTYKCPTPYGGYNYYDAPISLANEKTPVWYAVKNINWDVHALTDVFLGCQMLAVGHTNAETPYGCRRLTPDMLPDPVASVTSDGQGVAVSMIQNGSNLYVVVLNADIHHHQNVTIEQTADCKEVLPDGSVVASAKGTKHYDLGPGRVAILLVDENRQPLDLYRAEEPVRSNYRDNTPDLIISANPDASNGYFLPDMGERSWNVYSRWIDPQKGNAISRRQAVENWGSEFVYSIEVPTDIDVDIRVRHSVPWSAYGRVASIGAAPGFNYVIEDDPTLNWPKQYAAAMTLSIDGVNVVPADQPMRPAVPEVFTDDGAEFNAILADKSRWISTKNPDGTPSDVLYFWPKAGGDEGDELSYNAKPDYANIHLSAGTHRIVVTSLSYPWNFDNLLITEVGTTGIDSLADGGDSSLSVFGGIAGKLSVESASPFRVYNLAGTEVAAGGPGTASINLPAGLYIVAAENGKTAKAMVK